MDRIKKALALGASASLAKYDIEICYQGFRGAEKCSPCTEFFPAIRRKRMVRAEEPSRTGGRDHDSIVMIRA